MERGVGELTPRWNAVMSVAFDRVSGPAIMGQGGRGYRGSEILIGSTGSFALAANYTPGSTDPCPTKVPQSTDMCYHSPYHDRAKPLPLLGIDPMRGL